MKKLGKIALVGLIFSALMCLGGLVQGSEKLVFSGPGIAETVGYLLTGPLFFVAIALLVRLIAWLTVPLRRKRTDEV